MTRKFPARQSFGAGGPPVGSGPFTSVLVLVLVQVEFQFRFGFSFGFSSVSDQLQFQFWNGLALDDYGSVDVCENIAGELVSIHGRDDGPVLHADD
jgi:hypothetical protein